MFKNVVLILSTLFFAFSILTISFLRAASVNYAFSKNINLEENKKTFEEECGSVIIDYTLAYPGRILPDNPLWSLKAFRDKLWLTVTINHLKKADLMLLFSDKRLWSAKMLFEKGKADIAFSTLTKGEKYLEKAAATVEEERKRGADTKEIDSRVANASLKHREEMESLLLIAPEDAKPQIIKLFSYSNNAYNLSRDALLSKGVTPPENPFNKP